jgi:hypothetical protein
VASGTGIDTCPTTTGGIHLKNNKHSNKTMRLALRAVVVIGGVDCCATDFQDTFVRMSHPAPEVAVKADIILAKLLGPADVGAPKPTWRDWLKLRDALGDFEPATMHRYPNPMIE